MSIADIAFLALVVFAFSLFLVVLLTTYILVNLPERPQGNSTVSRVSVQVLNKADRKAG